MADGTGLDAAKAARQDETALEQVVLHLDNGAIMRFSGRQFAGGSWYDEETRTLTRQTLYVTSADEQVYVIATARGRERSRRAYRVSMRGEHCVINDGRQEMALETGMLMLAVQNLVGLDKNSSPPMDVVEDTLRAANC